jgi:glycosyltransferase involved in cell wall biosynthesis
MLLRGVVSNEILTHERQPMRERKNWVAYSGTLTGSKGLVPLIEAWKVAAISGWELHIAGDGQSARDLRRLAEGSSSIVLLDRKQNAQLLGDARIGINPHDVSKTPGNVFAFKIIEYLAAGAHVISTPMGVLEPEIERGITYMTDNAPDTIAATLKRVIAERLFERTADQAAQRAYGPTTVARALNDLLTEVKGPPPGRDVRRGTRDCAMIRCVYR